MFSKKAPVLRISVTIKRQELNLNCGPMQIFYMFLLFNYEMTESIYFKHTSKFLNSVKKLLYAATDFVVVNIGW